MPRLGSYEVSILANGQPLPEHTLPDDDEPHDKAITKYLEASAGSQFSIRVTLLPNTKFPTGHKAVYLYIDGTYVGGTVFSRSEPAYYGTRTHEHTHINFSEGSSWVRRPFVFNNLITSDENIKSEELKKIAKNIGRIRVKVHDFQSEGTKSHVTGAYKSAQAVPEKALKGQPISMAAGFGRAEPTAQPIWTKGRHVGPRCAEIILKYRSRSALQLMDLIPASPEPQPLEERDVNTLNLEEARQLASQLQEQAKQTPKIKKERVKVERKEEDTTPPASRKRNAADDDKADDDCLIVEVKKRRFNHEEIEVFDLS